MSKENAEKLRQARILIDAPNKWCKGSEHIRRENAHLYCALGACRAVNAPTYSIYRIIGDVCRYRDFQVHITYYNDMASTTHADIMAVFDKAIAAEESDA